MGFVGDRRSHLCADEPPRSLDGFGAVGRNSQQGSGRPTRDSCPMLPALDSPDRHTKVSGELALRHAPQQSDTRDGNVKSLLMAASVSPSIF